MEHPNTFLGRRHDRDWHANLAPLERREHIAIFGATGVGKSTLLLNIIAQDIARGDGILVLDPNGDLAEAAMALVPRRLATNFSYFNVTDADWPVAFNLVDAPADRDQRALLVTSLVTAFRFMWDQSWGDRMADMIRNACQLLVDNPGTTLLDLLRVLKDQDFRERLLGRCTNFATTQYFHDTFDRWDARQQSDYTSPVSNKIGAFLHHPLMQNILGQPRSKLDLGFAMNNRRIVLVNLSIGQIGDDSAYWLGALILARARAAALARAALPEAQRVPFHILIDEAHEFGAGALPSLYKQMRKLNVSVTAATQDLRSYEPQILSALLNAAQTLVCFQTGYDDARLLAPHFNRGELEFNPTALTELVPKREAYVRTHAGTFGIDTYALPQPAHPQPEKLRAESRQRFAAARSFVEAKLDQDRRAQTRSKKAHLIHSPKYGSTKP